MTYWNADFLAGSFGTMPIQWIPNCFSTCSGLCRPGFKKYSANTRAQAKPIPNKTMIMNDLRLSGYEGDCGTSAAEITRAPEDSILCVEDVSLKRFKNV